MFGKYGKLQVLTVHCVSGSLESGKLLLAVNYISSFLECGKLLAAVNCSVNSSDP